MSKNSHPMHKNAPFYLTKYRAYVKIGCELFLYICERMKGKKCLIALIDLKPG